MQYSVNLSLTDDTVARVNGLLTGTLSHQIQEGRAIWSTTARFPDGSWCRVQVISQGRGLPPYLSPELVDPQGKVDTETIWPADIKGIEGVYQWATNEDLEYRLVIEQEK